MPWGCAPAGRGVSGINPDVDHMPRGVWPQRRYRDVASLNEFSDHGNQSNLSELGVHDQIFRRVPLPPKTQLGSTINMFLRALYWRSSHLYKAAWSAGETSTVWVVITLEECFEQTQYVNTLIPHSVSRLRLCRTNKSMWPRSIGSHALNIWHQWNFISEITERTRSAARRFNSKIYWFFTGTLLVLYWCFTGSLLVLYWYYTGTLLVLYWGTSQTILVVFARHLNQPMQMSLPLSLGPADVRAAQGVSDAVKWGR